MIFDFGRYGKTWGYLRFQGEGVMRVWRGERAVRQFLNEQRSFRDSVGIRIEVTEEEERQILAYYENLLKDAKWRKHYPDRHHTRYRLAEDYYGVTIQCTSMSLDGLREVWPSDRFLAIFDLRFNRGRGFDAEQREYFFRRQRELSRTEVALPLDVLVALRAAIENGNPDVGEVRSYSRR